MDAGHPLFSVCILDHHAPTVASCLSAAMQSLVQSKVKNFEVMVVSASPEISLSLHDVVEAYPDIRIVVLPEGTSKIDALNYCVRKTKGDLLTIFHSNVIPSQAFFSHLYAYREKVNWFSVMPAVRVQEIGVGGTQLVQIPEKSRFSSSDFSIEFKYGGPHPAPVLYAPVGVSTWRRELLVQLDGFQNVFTIFKYAFLAEAELSYRAWTFGYGSLFDPGLSVTVVPVNASRSFYASWPSLLEREDFFHKLAWNLSKDLFQFRNRIPLTFKSAILDSLVRFDLLAVLVRLVAGLVFVLRPEKYPKFGKSYGFDRIKSMTDKDSL
jgi:hypothetical protein